MTSNVAKDSPTLALTDELCDTTLVFALRHFSPVLETHDDVPRCISAYLNANLRTAVPAASRAALMRLTWIDLDIAFRLGGLWLLNTMRTMHPLTRPLQYSLDALTVAAQAGHLHLFEWWRKTWSAGARGQPIIYANVDRIMDVASEFGHVHILAWCVKQERMLDFEHSEHAMDKASAKGFVCVLDWWLEEHRQSGRELKYTAAAVDSASAAGHLAVLQWWKDKSGILPFKFSPTLALPQSVSKGVLPIFVWWKYSGYVVVQNLSRITASAVRSNMLALLRWIRDNGYLQVELQHVFMACSVPKIKLAVVEFLWQHLPAESKSDINASPAYVAASRAGRVDLLDYLQTLGLGWEDDTVEHATTAAVVLSVLEWWFERKPAWNVHTVRLVLSDASARGDVASLQWMLEVGLLKHDVANTPVFADGTLSRMLDDAFVSRSIDTLDWWQAFLASDGFDADSCDMSQADIQAKFSELLNVAIAVNWTDHVVWAHKHGHILKLDSSCLISSQQGADAFDKCLELYHDGMAAGPSTNWKALGIRDPTEWAKSGIEIACRAGNLQALELYWHCSAVVRDGRGYYGLKEASELGHIHVLHWWLDKKLPLANNEVSCPAAFLNPFSFDFWSRHKDQLPFTVLPPKTIQAFMSLAPEVKHIPSIAALSYAFKSGMVSIPSATFVLELTTCGLASYLEWWFVYCGRPEEAWSQLSGEAMVSATFYQWPSVLEWWKHSGIKLKVPYTHIDQVRGSSKAVAWWRASGLVEV